MTTTIHMSTGILRNLLAFIGQASHVSPLMFCCLGMFLAHPTIWSLLSIPISLFSTLLVFGMALTFKEVLQGLKVYYDFCVRFVGCPLEQHTVEEYVGVEVWNSVRRLQWITSGVRDRRKIDRSLSVEIFLVNRNIKPRGKTLRNFAAYMATSRPQRSYIFTRKSPSQSENDSWGIFQILHEVGHTGSDAQYQNTPFQLGTWPLLGVLLWFIATSNLSGSAFSLWSTVAILLILTLGRNLFRVASNERWIFDETLADLFALHHMTPQQRQEILDDVRDGFLFEAGRSSEENRQRSEIFTENSIALSSSKGQIFRPSIRRLTNSWMVYSTVGVALFAMGVDAQRLDLPRLISLLFLQIGVPICVLSVLVAVGSWVDIKVFESVKAMTKNGEPIRIRILDSFGRLSATADGTGEQ